MSQFRFLVFLAIIGIFIYVIPQTPDGALAPLFIIVFSFLSWGGAYFHAIKDVDPGLANSLTYVAAETWWISIGALSFLMMAIVRCFFDAVRVNGPHTTSRLMGIVAFAVLGYFIARTISLLLYIVLF